MPTPVAEISSARFSPSSLLIINFPSISNSSSKLYRRRHPLSGMRGAGCLFHNVGVTRRRSKALRAARRQHDLSPAAKPSRRCTQKDRFPHLSCGNLPFCTYNFYFFDWFCSTPSRPRVRTLAPTARSSASIRSARRRASASAFSCWRSFLRRA